MTGYALFFAGTAAIVAPSVILCWFLASHQKRAKLRESSGAQPAPA